MKKLGKRATVLVVGTAIMVAIWGCGKESASGTQPAVSVSKVVGSNSNQAPATIIISADVKPVEGGAITKVEFYNGASKLGEVTTAPYDFAWKEVPAGNYEIRVVAYSDKGESATATTNVKVPEGNLVLVETGTYKIGFTSYTSPKFANAKPVHDVTVSNFYLSRYEVTFDEFDAFTSATGRSPVSDLVNSVATGRGSKPVFGISWYDAVEYCNWRSTQEGLTPVYAIDKINKDPNNQQTDVQDPKKWTVTWDRTANGYRLPTEAEWEYAARGGNKTLGYNFSGSNILSEVAVFGGGTAPGTTTTARGYQKTVGSLKANELGIYDMTGNVHEYVWDKYDTTRVGYATDQPENDPTGRSGNFNRFILRGGQSGSPVKCSYLVKRFTKTAAFTMCPPGFRLARNKS
jgi:formylglycine-generating enzyme required for sulfatase activity